jgi:hypothetical protein
MKLNISILYATIVAGCLDGIAAVVFLGNMDFNMVWKYVASGLFGIRAFSGGNEMVAYGLLFHFSIAFFWTVVYFLFLKNSSFLKKNVIAGGLLFGILLWAVMNLVVLPFTHVPPSPPLTIERIMPGLLIIMLCVGLPIALIIQKRNSSKNKTD